MMTLEDVVDWIDGQSETGTGVTGSLVSAWELGRYRTSLRYRRLLCRLYGAGQEELFAHQAELPGSSRARPDWGAIRVKVGYPALLGAMVDVVHNALETLIITGSRSRSQPYLEAIEHALAARPALVHYRVLYGPPRHPELLAHLERLLSIRDPSDRSAGFKTLHIGLVTDIVRTPERFFIASEREAFAIIPSVSSADGFDTGITMGKDAAAGLLAHGREAYAGARRVETMEALRELVKT